MQKKVFTCEFAGRKLTAEFSDLAELTNGSVRVQYGETVVFATAIMSSHPKANLGYFPLTVDYQEKFYAVGKLLGSRFVRRETRSSDTAVLVSRIIDRTIRPLFNYKIRNEMQVIVDVLAYDEENSPDVPALLAASLALATSDIPWNGPICGVRVMRKDGNFIVNPTKTEREGAELLTFVCGKDGRINMVEAEAKEVPEAEAVKAFELALVEIEKMNVFQREIIKEIGQEKIELNLPAEPEGLQAMFDAEFAARLGDALYVVNKSGRNIMLGSLKEEWMKAAKEKFGDELANVYDDTYEVAIDELLHKNILEHDKRPDGRKTNELRNIYSEAGVLPRVHGSGIFYRGQTHVLSVLTLGSPGDHKLIDEMETQGKKYFMHNYNFIAYASGEIKPLRGQSRREIGHGALAEKAILAVIPDREKFPYTIRIVSECMSSNGSTSMGSVCGATLALMDAGVPIKAPVAGIAMGLVMKDDKNYKVLTDIQGPEDHHGDMDFKAAGTATGLTAIQMDVKIEGVTVEILTKALADALTARLKILDVMLAAIPATRPTLSQHAPRITIMKINPEKIGALIGPGGKVINGIIAATGAQIDIDDDGSVFILSRDDETIKKAMEMVDAVTKEYKPGEVAVGKVVKTFEFGAMVELSKNQSGLIHVSKLASFRVNKVTDIVNIGDMVEVKITDIDDQGRLNLSLVKKL
jgi:polyribonucleotide nucleotidyltransferase